jgi:hypothetical protein
MELPQQARSQVQLGNEEKRDNESIILHRADSDITLDSGQAGNRENAGQKQEKPEKKTGRPAGRFLGVATGHLTHLL